MSVLLSVNEVIVIVDIIDDGGRHLDLGELGVPLAEEYLLVEFPLLLLVAGALLAFALALSRGQTLLLLRIVFLIKRGYGGKTYGSGVLTGLTSVAFALVGCLLSDLALLFQFVLVLTAVHDVLGTQLNRVQHPFEQLREGD